MAKLLAQLGDRASLRDGEHEFHFKDRCAGIRSGGQARVEALDIDLLRPEQVRDAMDEARLVHRRHRQPEGAGGPAGGGWLAEAGVVRRPQFRMQAAVLGQLRQISADLGHDGVGTADEGHHGKLPAQVDHARVFHIPASLEDEFRNFIHQPWAV